MRLKALALAFSVVLWFFVAGQSGTEMGFIVPVGFKGSPADLVMTGARPNEVDVRVTGPKLFVKNLVPSQITAEIDLSNAKEGVNAYNIKHGDIATPMGITVSRVLPDVVEVHMERLVEKSLPVKVRLAGRPADGYRVSDVAVSPASVSVSWIKKDGHAPEVLYTKPVDLKGISYSTTIAVPLDASSHGFRYISADKVRVRIIVEKER